MAESSVVQQLNLFKDCQSFVPEIDLTPDSVRHKFTFVDLFAGIGGFRIALEQLGGKCVAYSEIDREAIAVYEKNFLQSLNCPEVNLGDVRDIGKLPQSVDLIVGGVPCQPWSIAGKIKGFDDERGQLWFDVIRIVELNRPKSFIFENVKGLTEPRHQESLNCILNAFQNLNYSVKYEILNSYDFGLSQDRDRVFIVGIQKEIDRSESFKFPKPLDRKTKLYQFIEAVESADIEKKKFAPEILFGDRIPAARGRFQKNDELNDFFLFTDVRDGHTTIHSWDLIETTPREKLICQTLLRNRRKKKYGDKDGNPLSLEHFQALIADIKLEELEQLVNKRILRKILKRGYDFVNSKISAGIDGVSKIILPHADAIGTLTATGMRDYVATVSLDCQEPNLYKRTFIQKIYKPKKFKPLSARDYARLQGFPNWFQLAIRESTAKKQLGNAVSVPVVYHLSKSLLNIIVEV
ncbi:DNA cytosine methyltransferase [Baaleninema sp.]|uniref:DNA cytosine methyltransferase n=1 Tax=Baaleninema sp. TaxID=3101197 RepID=UPI003CFE35F6